MPLLRETYFLRLVAANWLALYLAFALIRLLMYAYNSLAFVGLSWGELFYILLAGLWFDTSAICYAQGLFALLWLLPQPYRLRRGFATAMGTIWVLLNAALLLIELADVVYFPYSFRRLTLSDMEMKGDFLPLLPTMIAFFWWVLLLLVFGSWLLGKWYGKTVRKMQARAQNSEKPRAAAQWAIFALALPLLVLGMRGGIQQRPLSSIAALSVVSNPRFAALPSNATLNLIHSTQQKNIILPTYYSPEELSQQHTVARFRADTLARPPRRLNVVVLIIESYGKEYIHALNPSVPKLTPFLDSLCGQGLLFTQAQANGTRSTQGVVAVSSGVPALMSDPFVLSAFQQNRISSFASMLGVWGYSSAFFHPATNGSMFFDSYAKGAGYQHYVGRNEYTARFPDSISAHFDGSWGIFDAPFFRYTIERIGELDTPFVATYFTINPHHPHNIPAEFAARYSQEPPVFRSIRYADAAVAEFFARAKQQDWYENTLFIITADHVGAAFAPSYSVRPRRYQIPIIFFQPKDSLLQRRQSAQLAQQIDILPTALCYLGYPFDFEAFGRNLLRDTSFENYHYSYDEGIYQLLDTAWALHFDGEKVLGLYDYKRDSFCMDNHINAQPQTVKWMTSKLKAFIQEHHRRMLGNDLPK